MTLITNSNKTLTAGETQSDYFTATGTTFVLDVISGEVVLKGCRSGQSTYLPVFRDADGLSYPALKGPGSYVVQTVSGRQYKCTAGPAGAQVEADQ